MRGAAALFALPGLALATGVSLSEFHPTVSGLSSNCESLYKSTLPGCQPSDFTSGHCSQSCLSSLNTVTSVIHKVCGHENLHGTNLISAFLAGDGTQKICPNAPGNSASSSPSSSAQQNTGSTVASSAAVQTTASSSFTTSSAASIAASTTSSAALTSASTPAGIEIDSTGSPTVQSTAASSSTSSANSQQNIAHGGSPFDMSGNVSAAERYTAHMIPSIAAALVIALFGSLAI